EPAGGQCQPYQYRAERLASRPVAGRAWLHLRYPRWSLEEPECHGQQPGAGAATISPALACSCDMNRPLLWAWLGLALASLCWAGNALVARAFAGDIPSFSLGFWRWALALGLLLPLAGASLWRHRQLLCRAGWRLWLAALLAITTFNSL